MINVKDACSKISDNYSIGAVYLYNDKYVFYPDANITSIPGYLVTVDVNTGEEGEMYILDFYDCIDKKELKEININEIK